MMKFSKNLALVIVITISIVCFLVESRLAGECAMICNDLRFEVLTLEMCREAKRTLPKPKVGDFCSTAMEQGFSDACIALCMEQKPIARVAQTCRAAAVEMPRPTVRRWCEHGYTVAYKKTLTDLAFHFRPEPEQQIDEPIEQRELESESISNEELTKVGESIVTDHVVNHHSGGQKDETRSVLATIPITLDDTTLELTVYNGQNAEDAVVDFCRQYVPDDVSPCIRQLLSVVLEKLDELSQSAQ
eukprot:gene14049-18842_t